MAFGRLDVFWPDGLLKTYLLSEPNISIGRSSGNTIALETDTISRYHMTITLKDNEVYITDLDSVNGTFVDGVKLKDNQPHRLFGGEEIMIGELRLIYHDVDENPTRPIVVPEEATRYIELKAANFHIDLEGPEIPISPGAHTSAQVTITNTGDKAEHYSIEVSGVPREWVRIDRPELEIPAGKSTDVMISFKPLRRSESAPGDYKVEVNVKPKGDPSLALQAVVTLHVLPYSGFGMALETTHIRSNERFRLHLHNQGSDTLPLTLMSRDLTNNLRFNLPSPQISLAPGQRMLIQGQVRSKQHPIFGETRQFPFDLIVRSGDASGFLVATRGYVVEKPPLPAWAAYALGGIVTAILLIIIVGVVLLLHPAPEPIINSFGVSSTRIAQGDPLSLNWTAENANSLVVSVNGTPVANLDADATSAQLDTSAYSGEVLVEVSAQSGSREATASERVMIYEPLRINYFNVDQPMPLVRYTVQTLTFNWSVSSAQTVQLLGIETFSTNPIASAYGATGTVSVAGYLDAESITVTLVAQAPDGETLEETLTLTTINPQCTARTNVNLYSGPTPQNQVVGTVESGQTVVVDARDQNGGWLRVQIAGGAHGWGERTQFTCADNFNVDDLQIDLNFPTPIPVPSDTPTST
ncbi:MAG TPA: FHA domain-containing protein, partial [Oceanobacillus sp.]|nr:FHA domain-containing protein [Oceanobacillus sp.]